MGQRQPYLTRCRNAIVAGLCAADRIERTTKIDDCQ
jgi:hypothetical protein